MASLFSTTSQIAAINTRARSGVITLPLTTASLYRQIMIKDLYGAFPLSTLTLSTQLGDAFEDGTTSRILSNAYEFQSLYAGSTSRWHTVGGTQITAAYISSLRVDSLQLGSGDGWADFGPLRATAISSLLVQTGLVQANAMSTFAISTGTLTAGNISTATLSTNYGFFSTISSGSVFGRFVGDGSLLTAIPNTGAVLAVSNLVNTNTTNITTISNLLNSVSTNVTTVSTNLNTLSNNVTTISNTGATNATNITTVSNTAGTNATNITTISNLLNSVSTNVTNVSTNLNTLSNNVTTISNTGATNATNITTVSNTAGTNATNITTISNRVNYLLTVSNYSAITMSTSFGFFSTISTGLVYGKHIGDGSGLTGLPVAAVGSVLSTQAFYVSSISSANITSAQGYISSLTVDSLSFGFANSYMSMGDIITTSVSSIQIFTSSLITTNLQVGNVSTLSYIAFPGLQQGYTQTVVAEQATGTGTQELLIFKGSTNTDRIRMQTTGTIVFEPGVSARVFPNASSNATPAMIITTGSNVGIGVAAPTVALDVAGAGRFTAVSTNTVSTNQVNSGNICNVGWLSNNGVLSNTTAGAFFQATSNTTTLGVAQTATFASNITQTGGTTTLAGLSVNTISTNQVNSSNICNAGWFSNNGVLSNITAGAFFQATSNTTTLGVAQTATFASNISQTGGTTTLAGLSVNTISTNTILANNISANTISTSIVNAGYLVGLLPGNTAATSVSPLAVGNGNGYLSFSPQIEFQYYSGGGYKHFMGSRHNGSATNNFGNAIDFWLYSATTGANASTTPGTCNVNTMSVTAAGVGIFNNSPSLALDVAGSSRIQTLSTTSISTNQVNSGNICNVGWLSNNGVLSNTTAGAFFQATSNTTTLGVAQTATFASNITQTGGTTVLAGLSVNTISTNNITASNISTNSISTNFGFFSTISTGLVYGKHIGDGSGLTGLPAAGAGVTSTLSTLVFLTSTISTANLTSQQGYISSLTVDYLAIGSNFGYVNMGDIIATSLSSIAIETQTLTTSNLKVGVVSSLSYIAFPGLQQGYAQSVVAEQSTGTGLQELLVFRGSSASDRIRMQTTGSIVFEPGVSARVYPAVPSNVTPAMIITTGSNVGIGIAAPGVSLDVAGAGRFTAVSTNTISTASITAGATLNVTATYASFSGEIQSQGGTVRIVGNATTLDLWNYCSLTQTSGNITINSYSNINTTSSSNININATSTIYISSGASAINLSGNLDLNNKNITNVNFTRPVAVSTNTISTNQVNSSNICNAGFISNNGILSNITAGAFFQNTSNTGTLGVAGAATFASNITQTAGGAYISNAGNFSNGGSATFFSNGTSVASHSTTNAYPFATFKINTAGTNTATPVTPLLLMVGNYGGSIAGGLTQGVGAVLTLGTIPDGGATQEGYRLTGSNSAFYGNVNMQGNNISNVGEYLRFSTGSYMYSAKQGGFTSAFLDIVGTGGDGQLRLINGTSEIALRANSDLGIVPTSGYSIVLNGPITANYNLNMNNSNISNVNTIRTTALSTNSISTSLIIAGYVSSPQAYISSLTVDSLSFGLSNANIIMGDIITTSVSTVQVFTSSLLTTNLQVGIASTLSYIAFPGLQQGYAQTVVAEQATGAGTQELLLFKGSTNTDRIRMQTTGSIVFEPGVGARVFPSASSNATPAMIITTGSNVGIGIAAPTYPLQVLGGAFVGGYGLAVDSVYTDQLNATTSFGIGKADYNVGGQGSPPVAIQGYYGVVIQGGPAPGWTAATPTFTAVNGKVGILNSNPTVALDVAGAGRFTAVSTITISTNTILANNISTNSLAAFEGFFSTFGTELGFSQEAYFSTIFTENLYASQIYGQYGGVIGINSAVYYQGNGIDMGSGNINQVGTYYNSVADINMTAVAGYSINNTGSNINLNASSINMRGTSNTKVQIGPRQYQGTAADTTTYGLERSRHEIQFAGYRDAQIDKIGSKIVNINKQTYGNSGLRHLIQSADLAFFTVPPDTSDIDNTVERMRITDGGNVGIGTTAPTVSLDVAGAGRFTAVSTNTISSGTVYGRFIGDGSGITGISGGGSIPSFLSTNNISTGIITTSNIRVGTISTNSYVSYPGLAQQYTQSILAEQETGTGLQEMLIFRGSSASDRIRLQTTGYIVFETGVGARVYPTITSNVTPSWMIDVNGCVGVGIIPSGTATKLDVAGQGRFQNLSTTSIQAGSINLSVAFV